MLKPHKINSGDTLTERIRKAASGLKNGECIIIDEAAAEWGCKAERAYRNAKAAGCCALMYVDDGKRPQKRRVIINPKHKDR